jgi:hypothetical protein
MILNTKNVNEYFKTKDKLYESFINKKLPSKVIYESNNTKIQRVNYDSTLYKLEKEVSFSLIEVRNRINIINQ